MMVVRNKLNAAIRDAAEHDDRRRLCTLRLIQTAIRDRDQAHCTGSGEKISVPEVTKILCTLVRHRENRRDAAVAAGNESGAQEVQREIDVIREFMPPVMDEPTLQSVCAQVVKEIGAAGLRDVSRTIAALNNRYPGQIDTGRADLLVRGMLA